MNPDRPPRKCDLRGYDFLQELALNLRSSWNHEADLLWRYIDKELWELSRNPWAVLQTVSRERAEYFFTDPVFAALVENLLKAEREAPKGSCWFGETHPATPLKRIAYFSMEFMLSEALPIYSGGLGNVAGDQLKAASDLGVPLIGIGLLYSRGYFRQVIDENSEQREIYPYNDPGQLPVKPLRLETGDWLRLKIDLPGGVLRLRAWEVKVGSVKLYLLDSNDLENFPDQRGITGELYGGDLELRLQQELVLGIGGMRLLSALGIEPEVCHMNEGHAAFAVLERARIFMEKKEVPFDTALAAVRGGNVFTTHTAVAAGFDRFPPDLLKKHLGRYAETGLGISFEKLLSLGRAQGGEDFIPAYLGVRGSGFVNGVSVVHGKVSRRLFAELFPRIPLEEVPIGSITNGVHIPSWDSCEADALWTKACGKGRWLGKTEYLEQKIRDVPDTEIWAMRNRSRASLIERTRSRLVRQFKARGASEEMTRQAESCLRGDVLTLGFARRFAGYKRPDLLLADEERFLRILTDPERPVQLIIAGKAHPADLEGHALIKKWMQYISRPEVRSRVVFLSDYDTVVAADLVQGVDVWVNTPRRPWEACGTSGMKILVNGGLNLSELDGWWAEAYTPEVGWAVGEGPEAGDERRIDAIEADALYTLLEREVAPEFYKRDARDVPSAWVAKIRESMARLTPLFSSNRTVREYVETMYLPAAERYLKRSAENGAEAKRMAERKCLLQQSWGRFRFGDLRIESDEKRHRFSVEVYLPGVDPSAIQAQLYSEGFVQEMEYAGRIEGKKDGHLYRAEPASSRPASSFTPRIIPRYPGVNVPLEMPYILWQR